MTTYRSGVAEVFQIGDETSPGVGGTADKKPKTLQSDIGISGDAFPQLRPSGSKYIGDVVPGDIWSRGPYSRGGDLNVLPFLAAANIGYAAPTTVSGATTWRHTPTP